MVDNLESIEVILRDRMESAKAGQLDKIAMAQSRILLGGIGDTSQDDLERSVKLRQIGGVVDKRLLHKLPNWEIGVTSHAVAQLLLDEFGRKFLSDWYEINAKHPLTQDRRVVEVMTSIAEALAKENDNEKTA